MRPHRVALVAVLLCNILPSAALTQARRALTADDYARAERALGPATGRLVSGIPGRPSWLADGRASYRVSTATGWQFVVVDPRRRTRTPAFDHARLAAAVSATLGRRVGSDSLPFVSFDLSPDGRQLTFDVTGADPRRLKCDLTAYRCAAVDNARRAPPPNSILSPDSSRAVFIRDNNLWMTNLTNGTETALTTDGVEDFGYGTDNAGWVKSDEPVVTWSPDSRKIATFQHDGRGVSRMYLVRTQVGAPELQAWRYPLPGDSVIFRIQRVVIDVSGPTPQLVRLQMPPDAHRSMVSDHVACGGRICDLLWYPDASAIAFVSSSRDHKHAWVRVADARTGVVRTLLEEQAKTQVGEVGVAQNWRVLPGSNELIWWSERDGWIHLYLYDLTTGRLKNPITGSDGNVESIVYVDEKARTIYFSGQGMEKGRDPYYRFFYRIGFDGRGQTLLTPEDADHQVAMAPDGASFIDSYSTPVAPPVTVLRDRNGRVVLPLERADISRLVAAGWHPPTPITLKARDGTTDLYGLMFTPARLDSGRTYPLVDYIYPMPSGSVGPRSFVPARGDHQALAELGFVVVVIDGMGTRGGRSKTFRDAAYGKMEENTLPDQVAAIKQLAARYPWIDGDRVGIWGHSGGGFATAAAMFNYPDVFKVGISESGNHDNRNYEDDWGERYQGLLVKSGESDNYAAEANEVHAANLRGKLLLAHGGMDDNVPPYNTYLVVDALIKANKDFDLLILPNARHGYGRDSNYMMRRRWDYFVRNLLGAEPPHEYEIGKQNPPLP
ncbi:MAG TPA: DPP IV N-terminal domain-containing protein [Gemmatimonadales bacterium]|nr:DPP IV N-terminal domain-containing protein [Gemmatimonadales bacterium]